jgi:hypothetical protein
LFYFACEAAGALGIRHSLRPFYRAYEKFLQTSGAWRREIEFGCLKTCPAFVPRMLRSAPPFAAWCAADPGSIARHEKFESRLRSTPRLRRAFGLMPPKLQRRRLRSSVEETLHRVRDTRDAQHMNALIRQIEPADDLI